MKNKCNTCIYRAANGQLNKCDYMFITGHSRRCEVNNGCKVYKRGNRIQRKHTVDFVQKRSSDEQWLDKFYY